jgi:hypothetical protein
MVMYEVLHLLLMAPTLSNATATGSQRDLLWMLLTIDEVIHMRAS